MRRSITRFLLLAFVCALPLQAYAQACALHCALMQTGATDKGTLPQSDDAPPCAQSGLCELAAAAFVLPLELTADVVFVSSTPSTAVESVPDRTPAPPDRPPIFS
ncbi:MAG TPA: hypothetical protein VJS66_04455 [Burkholderiales bacterium]|nr:hypothetical protein [Burkholderiales bacterium]